MMTVSPWAALSVSSLRCAFASARLTTVFSMAMCLRDYLDGQDKAGCVCVGKNAQILV
jgi:hypothetical protein